MCRILHLDVHRSDVIQALQAAPQGLSTGLTVAVAPEETPQCGDAVHGLVQRRRFPGSRGVCAGKDHQRSPLRFLEVHAARCLRHFTTELGQVVGARRVR